jgi:alpha-N-arabinofuranosidase
MVDYVSLHLYGATTQLADGPDEYDAIVAQPQYFEQEIQEYSSLATELVARNGTRQPLGLALDEWNIRHLEPADWPEPQPSDDGGTAGRDIGGLTTSSSLRVNRWSPRTLADALFYAGVFHSLHRASSLPVPVTMANTVNLVNANGVVALSDPHRVALRDRGVIELSGGGYDFPPHSITLLSFSLRR